MVEFYMIPVPAGKDSVSDLDPDPHLDPHKEMSPGSGSASVHADPDPGDIFL